MQWRVHLELQAKEGDWRRVASDLDPWSVRRWMEWLRLHPETTGIRLQAEKGVTFDGKSAEEMAKLEA